MKLKPPDYKLRQVRIARFRAKSSSRSKQASDTNAHKTNTNPKKNHYEIIAPTEISLHTPRLSHELTTFLRSLRKATHQNQPIRINYSATNKAHSCGMLLMLAEIDRIHRVLGDKCRITCSYPNDETIEKLFQQIGLFQILKKKPRLQITEDDKNVYHWRYATGISVDPAEADPMLKGVRDQIPKGYRRIVAGVEEAMDNSVHHAYIEPREDRLKNLDNANERRWWVFAEVLDGWLHVIFCDLGVGIPATLPRKWEEQVKDILSLTSLSERKRDMRMIRRALELGRTRTEQGHRGKGLKNIAKAAEDLGGKLNVYSNMGVLGIDYGVSPPRYVQGTFKRSILGTVIQWSIPITGTQGLGNA